MECSSSAYVQHHFDALETSRDWLPEFDNTRNALKTSLQDDWNDANDANHLHRIHSLLRVRISLVDVAAASHIRAMFNYHVQALDRAAAVRLVGATLITMSSYSRGASY